MILFSKDDSMSVRSLPVSLSRNLNILTDVSSSNSEAVCRSSVAESITRLLLNTSRFGRNCLHIIKACLSPCTILKHCELINKSKIVFFFQPNCGEDCICLTPGYSQFTAFMSSSRNFTYMRPAYK